MTRALLFLALTTAARADVSTQPARYQHESTALEGSVTSDPALPGKRPGVLLAHDRGPADPTAKAKANQLARLGYVVFSADLVGKSGFPKDRAAARDRAAAGLAALVKLPRVDPNRVAAVGYGAGGTAVLDLARAKAELEGVACVHADVSPTGADGKNVGAAVLAVAGAADPAADPARLAAFEAEMTAGGVDWQLVRLGGVGGDFSHPQAGKGYDKDADRRADALVRLFLADALAAPAKPAPAAAKAAAPPGVPAKVLQVLEYVDKHGEAMPGYEGGRSFGNFERRLPQADAQGRRIRYREWDVNPLRPGTNRGAERLVTGPDGAAYYTADHYETFQKIR
jgi:dienelactone hydrolase/guanyl-specific ribonuclease Sa